MKPSIIYIGNKISNSKSNPTTHSTLVKKLREEGYTVFSASSKRLKSLRLLDMIWLFLRKVTTTDYVLIDVYSTQNFWYAVIIAKLARLFSVKYIPILHGGDLISRFNHSKKETALLLKNAYYIVSPSEYLKKEVEALGFDHVVNISNSLELKEYQFKNRAIIQPKLLWVRAFNEIYNPMMAIKTIEVLQEKYPQATLTMVGPDKDGSLIECVDYAKAKKLNICFKGKLKKKEWINLAANFDIFINTTRIDNIPVSVLEAISLGLPIISTNVGGIPYIIKDSVNGLLVESNNVEAMSQAVDYLITYPAKAKEMALVAQRDLEKYSWQAIKFDWFKILN